MAFFEKIFVRSQDKDKYLTGLSRSRKSFGDRIRALSNSFHGVTDELLEEIMIILLESDMGIHTAQKVVELFEERSKEIKNYDSMEDYLISILYDFYNPEQDEDWSLQEEGPTVIMSGRRQWFRENDNNRKIDPIFPRTWKKTSSCCCRYIPCGSCGSN